MEWLQIHQLSIPFLTDIIFKSIFSSYSLFMPFFTHGMIGWDLLPHRQAIHFLIFIIFRCSLHFFIFTIHILMGSIFRSSYSFLMIIIQETHFSI